VLSSGNVSESVDLETGRQCYAVRLRCFLFVEQDGSIGRAADEMGITQPTASHAIGQLEKQLGAILFIRHADGTTLSHTGELFAVRVRRFFDCLRVGFKSN